MYNPKSHKAEEFINHEEVLASLNYAEENKNNLELIDKILEKAKLAKGLTHREAAVLLCRRAGYENRVGSHHRNACKFHRQSGLSVFYYTPYGCPLCLRFHERACGKQHGGGKYSDSLHVFSCFLVLSRRLVCLSFIR